MRNLALAHGQANRYAEALDWIEKALAVEPDYLAAHCTRAKFLLMFRRPADALKVAEWVVGQDPQSHDGHYYRGVAQMLDGQREAGVESFRRAVELQDHSVRSHIALARALAEIDHVEEAMAEYRRVMELDPSNVEANQQLRQHQAQSRPDP